MFDIYKRFRFAIEILIYCYLARTCNAFFNVKDYSDAQNIRDLDLY